MSKPREIELKFALEQANVRGLKRHPLLRRSSKPAKRTHSIYFDTPDGKLRKQGVTLRVRQSGDVFVQTVKQAAPGSAGLFDRAEWEWANDAFELDLSKIGGTAADAPLRKAKDRAALEPTIETIFDRHTWDLVQDLTELEIVLDEGKIVAGGRSIVLTELELELKRGPQAALFEVARALAVSTPLRIGVLSKSEQGDRLLAGPTPLVVKAGPVRLNRKMTAAEGFVAIVGSCIRHLHLNEAGVAARNGEALHQARVALRRLRSAFSIFQPVVADDRSRGLRNELSALSQTLGIARDLDVFISKYVEVLEPAAREKISVERERAYDNVLKTLASQRYRTTIFDLVEWIAIGGWRDGNAGKQQLSKFASRALDRFWSKVKKPGKKLTKLDDETRHELRIAGKKLRYACDFFDALHSRKTTSKPRRKFMAALEQLQGDLGNLNDIVTARELNLTLSARIGIDLASVESEATDQQTEALLASAESAHGDLTKAGPFWR
jgi:inorganic triphosphatase YgiF